MSCASPVPSRAVSCASPVPSWAGRLCGLDREDALGFDNLRPGRGPQRGDLQSLIALLAQILLSCPTWVFLRDAGTVEPSVGKAMPCHAVPCCTGSPPASCTGSSSASRLCTLQYQELHKKLNPSQVQDVPSSSKCPRLVLSHHNVPTSCTLHPLAPSLSCCPHPCTRAGLSSLACPGGGRNPAEGTPSSAQPCWGQTRPQRDILLLICPCTRASKKVP